jgi:hypothetical protein
MMARCMLLTIGVLVTSPSCGGDDAGAGSESMDAGGAGVGGGGRSDGGTSGSGGAGGSGRRPPGTVGIAGMDGGASDGALDAETSDSAVPDGAAETPDLAATAVDTYVTSSGTTTEAVDLGQYDVTVLVYDTEEGAFSTHPPVVDGPGAFHVEMLPPGDRYIRWNRLGTAPSYFVSSSESVDFGTTRIGRPDKQSAADGSQLVFNVTGLAAWDANNVLQFHAPGAGVAIYDVLQITSAGAPQPSDTALSGLTFRPAFLVEGSKGDRAHLTELVTRTLPGDIAYKKLDRVFALPSFSMTNAQVTNIAGAFETPAETALEIDWKGSLFESTILAGTPSATIYAMDIGAFSQLQPEAGHFGGTVTLLSCTPPMSDLVASFDFSNPFPSAWAAVVSGAAVFYRGYLAPGATTPAGFPAAVGSFVTATDSVTLAPHVGPVENVTIEGLDARVDQTGVGTSPVVSFDPPSLGAPSSYEVTFLRLVNSAGTTERVLAGRILTTKTSVVVPPGILSSGQTYFMTVAAVVRGELDMEQTPLRSAYPYAYADVLSGHITP